MERTGRGSPHATVGCQRPSLRPHRTDLAFYLPCLPPQYLTTPALSHPYRRQFMLPACRARLVELHL
ncbi:hypothetical protein PMIN04_009895 [Paraphaeosphaeria minitans]